MVDEPTKKPPDARTDASDSPGDANAPERQRPRAFETTSETSSMESYLGGGGLYAKGAEHLTWMDRTSTRTAVRLISRGIFGAAAFALGTRYARDQMRNYHPEDWKFDSKKPLQAVAKGFDTVFGTPIKAVLRPLVGAKRAEDLVWFRRNAYYWNRAPHDVPSALAATMNRLPLGRSLGAEMVVTSFDFSCASAADAAVRNIIYTLDPNVKKPWRDEEGNFDLRKLLAYTGHTTWRILTKNAGEDWAVALPYVFQMKLQRRLIGKMAAGSKLYLDHGWNGGSYQLDDRGKVIGDYQKSGALDLQLRFTGYNWYTLMYRETYDAIGRGLASWKKNGFSLSLPGLPEHPVADTLTGVKDLGRYIIKSFIKANLYMQPSVPFFWVFRTPQSKWRSGPLNADYGYTLRAPVAKSDSLGMNQNRLFQGSTYGRPVAAGAPVFFHQTAITGHDLTNFDPYAARHQKSLFSKILNPFGKLSYGTGSKILESGLGQSLLHGSGRISRFFGQNTLDREALLREMVDASYSYTPYMIAKAEFGLRVDDRPSEGGLGKMDKKIYDAMDALGSFRVREFARHARDIGSMIMGNFSIDIGGKEGNLEVADSSTGQSVAKAGDGSLPPKLSAKPQTKVTHSSIIEDHRQALTSPPPPSVTDRHRQALRGEAKRDTQHWSEYLADKKKKAQLHSEHPTVQ